MPGRLSLLHAGPQGGVVVAPPWSPTSLPGLQLLLGFGQGFYKDTARTLPATVNGDPVAGIADQSGNGRHASAVGGTTPPVLHLAAVNGNPGLLMDGVQTIFETPSFTVNQPDTVFVAWKENTVNSGTRIAFRSLTSVQQVWNGNNKLNYYASFSYNGPTLLGAAPHGVTMIFNGASSVLRVDRVDDTVSGGDPGPNNLSGVVTIGGFSAGYVIDGYLLGLAICSGVVSGSDLINMETYMANYLGLPSGFLPNQIGGLKLWLQSGVEQYTTDVMATPATANNDPVGRWADQSGQGNHLTQPTAGKLSLLNTALVNGQSGVKFDGVDDNLGTTTASGIAPAGTQFTLFVVLKTPATLGTQALINVGGNTGGGSGSGKTLRISDAAGHLQMVKANVAGLGASIQALAPNTSYVVAFDYNSPSGAYYINGAGAGTISSAQTFSGAPCNDVFVGAQDNAGTTPFPGQVLEAVYYDQQISAADRNAVMNYLLTKYGFPLPPLPVTIPGLQLWLDAEVGVYQDAGTTPAAPDAFVQQWSDQSGNGNHALQATSSKRPVFKTAIVNGHPVLRFDNLDDALPCLTTVTMKHIFVVAFYSAASFVGVDGLISTASTDATPLIGGVSGPMVFYNIGTPVYHQNGTAFAASAMAAPMNAWGVMSVSDTAGWTGVPQIGADRGVANRTWKGDIAEVLVYDHVLSTSDRQALQNYLGTKYGITIA